MKSSVFALIVFSLPGVVLAAEGVGTAPKDKVPATAAAEAQPSKAVARKPPLEKGIVAADIIKFYGQPLEIVPIKSPDPAMKTERWIYRRKSGENTTEQVVNPAQTRQVMIRLPDGQTVMRVESVPVLIVAKRVVAYQVTALLMVNGRLELAKQWEQQEESVDRH